MSVYRCIQGVRVIVNRAKGYSERKNKLKRESKILFVKSLVFKNVEIEDSSSFTDLELNNR